MDGSQISWTLLEEMFVTLILFGDFGALFRIKEKLGGREPVTDMKAVEKLWTIYLFKQIITYNLKNKRIFSAQLPR